MRRYRMNNEQIKENVKSGYAKILQRNSKSRFLPKFLQCCDSDAFVADIGRKIGYSDSEMKDVPEEANLGIGCGNPTALASIQPGEIVLDLGSGAGFDCFLAAEATGEIGNVIGIDITPEMVKKAKQNAQKGNYKNVEFNLGDIESLPIEDNTIDLIISNCVINLSNRKEQVFKEAFRVAKPNGRLMISDIILLNELPEYVKNSVEGHIACLSGAVRIDDYLKAIANAGFVDIRIDKQTTFPIELMLSDPIAQKIVKENNLQEQEISAIANSIASVSISGRKQI